MAALRMVVISNARWRADICSEGVSVIGFMGCNGHLKDPEIMNQIFRNGGSRRATEGNRMKFFGLVLVLLAVAVGPAAAEVLVGDPLPTVRFPALGGFDPLLS